MYVMTIPKAMRVFVPVTAGATLLSSTARCANAGEVRWVREVKVMAYDHRDKLALLLDGEPLSYLLVEEVPGAERMAHEWTAFLEEEHAAKTADAKAIAKQKQKAVIAELSPILRKHIRPEATFEDQGPGIHFRL